MTTYQRLKKENEQLKRELYLVCCRPQNAITETLSIIQREKLKAKIETEFWDISHNIKDNNFKGILNQES